MRFRALSSASLETSKLSGSVMDVTATKKAFEEIKALRDELYKENIVLREEVDKTSMFEEDRGDLTGLASGARPCGQGGSDRLHGVHHR